MLFILPGFSVANLDFRSIECALTYRIMLFTEIPKLNRPYNICIDSSKEILKIYKEQLHDKKLNDFSLAILKATNENLTNCDVLYLGEGGSVQNHNIQNQTKKNNLIVFSSLQSNRQISIVLFQFKDEKVEFKVNKTLLDQTEIKMSSKVLRLASEVY